MSLIGVHVFPINVASECIYLKDENKIVISFEKDAKIDCVCVCV